jgi:hypothetical protein
MVEVAHVRTVVDFDAAFAGLAEKLIDGLVVASEPLFTSGQDRLLATRYPMPAILVVED